MLPLPLPSQKGPGHSGTLISGKMYSDAIIGKAWHGTMSEVSLSSKSCGLWMLQAWGNCHLLSVRYPVRHIFRIALGVLGAQDGRDYSWSWKMMVGRGKFGEKCKVWCCLGCATRRTLQTPGSRDLCRTSQQLGKGRRERRVKCQNGLCK